MIIVIVVGNKALIWKSISITVEQIDVKRVFQR